MKSVSVLVCLFIAFNVICTLQAYSYYEQPQEVIFLSFKISAQRCCCFLQSSFKLYLFILKESSSESYDLGQDVDLELLLEKLRKFKTEVDRSLPTLHNALEKPTLHSVETKPKRGRRNQTDLILQFGFLFTKLKQYISIFKECLWKICSWSLEKNKKKSIYPQNLRKQSVFFVTITVFIFCLKRSFFFTLLLFFKCSL